MARKKREVEEVCVHTWVASPVPENRHRCRCEHCGVLQEVVAKPRKGKEPQIANPGSRDVRVEFKQLDVRALLSLGPDHNVWTVASEHSDLTLFLPGYGAGAIVRVRPPSTASDLHIDRVRTSLKKLLVAAVRVEPRPPSDVVVPQNAAADAALSPRAVVIELATQAASVDKVALMKHLEETMAGVGL